VTSRAIASTLALLLAFAGGAGAGIADDRGREVRVAASPQRVVSLSPALTEMVCELGACALLVGIDRHANWPAAVRGLPRLGGLEDLQVERLAALKPDLVLAAVSTRAIERVEALGIPVLALEPRSLAGMRVTFERIGLALGASAAVAPAWRRLHARLETAAAAVPAAYRGRSVYFEVASAPYAAGEASFIGEVLARLGLVNIVPAALGPFPKLNPEFVIREQPRIVIARADALAEMPHRPGWSSLEALRSARVCALAPAQADLLMRAGPRLAEGAEVLAKCLGALARSAP
jgi:iron complex transport system substrate-binding protein